MLNDFYKICNLEELNIIIDKIDEIDIVCATDDFLLNDKILLKNTLYNIISEQKNKICNNNCDMNLSHLFKKHIFSARRIKYILDKFPNINRRLGKMPSLLLDKADNKTKCSKEIFKILAKYSVILNYDFNEDFDNEYELDIKTKMLAQELSFVVCKNINIEYIGHGVNGNGFKLSVENKNYFYKVFYPHNKFHDSNINYLHGGFIEPAFAMFANRNARKNQFVKFYIGQIATKYHRDAFMLTEFMENVPKNIPETLRIDYLTIKDSEILRFDNTKDGKIVDFGGLITNKNKDFQEAKIRKLVRVILQNIKFNHKEEKFAFSWEISDNNLLHLKTFIAKYDSKTYKRALNVIKMETNISKNIMRFLNEIDNVQKGISETKILSTKDLFSTNLDNIRNNIEQFKVKIKTESKPTSELFDGYLMLDLLNNTLCTVFYDINNKVKRIKIIKERNSIFDTIIELDENEIAQYDKCCPLYELIKSLAQV